MKFIRDALIMLFSSCQLTYNSVFKPYFAQYFGTYHYFWLCTVRSPKHWSLPAGNIQVLYRAQNSLTSSEIVKTLKECTSCSHYLLNNYFVVFLWLSFAVWVLTLNSWTLWMHEKVTEVLCLWCAIEMTLTLHTAHHLVSL